MAFSPGRNVGRLSIRVVPDTTKFRRELRKQLETIERTTRMTVNVNKARLDNQAIREDIRRQMQDMKNVEVEADVRVTIDKAKLKKTTLRKSIQEQFDQFDDIRVKIAAEIANKEHFEKEVRDMVDRASRNEAKISANAFTAIASRQMAFVSRDRIVNLIVRVNKKSVAAAMTTLAALSGARLSWKWIDDLANFAKDLDKNLPKILNWTTGITSLIGAIFATGSGLVGLGQGLFSILPAMLVLPGLLLNAVGSVTALIVALRNAGDELSPLKDDMSELGEIINSAFWKEARQPIIDLVQGLMPQLRNAFHDLSQGIGEFTAAMSRAFGEELAGGRLESIFAGIAEGWRVLGSGASGFAGALVSLSQIAATYTPRLAGWFVRQANTFDAWLKAIAEDGRLGDWMEDAIDSMYDLWDATRGLAGVFAGIWRAADQAGSGGLEGFGKLMLKWREVVNSADFQRGLSAVFRGSYTAMSAFGDAIRAIGRLVADLDVAFETFIGSAGKFLGGLLEGAADALNQPAVDEGIMQLSQGLIDALEGILPHLPRIAETFGGFLGLLGDLAGTLLPTAASALSALMPSIDTLIGAIQDVLPGLAEATTKVIDELGPAVSDLVTALSPLLVSVLETFGNVAPELAEALHAFVDVVRPLIDILAGFWEGWAGFMDVIQNNPMSWLWDEQSLNKVTDDLQEKGGWLGDLFKWAEDFDKGFTEIVGRAPEKAKTKAAEAASEFVAEYKKVLKTKGKGAADDFLEGLSATVPQDVLDTIDEQLKFDIEIKPKSELNTFERSAIDSTVKMLSDAFKKGGSDSATDVWNSWVMGMNGDKDPISPELRYWIAQGIEDIGVELNEGATGAGGGFSRSLAGGIAFGYPDVERELQNTRNGIAGSFANAGGLLTEPGRQTMGGLVAGLAEGKPGIATELTGVAGLMLEAMANSGSWLTEPGAAAMSGIGEGALAERPNVLGVFGGLGDMISTSASGASVGMFVAGIAAMGGFYDGTQAALPALTTSMAGLGLVLAGAMTAASTWLTGQGAETMKGFGDGARITVPSVVSVFLSLHGLVTSAVSGISLYGVGANLMSGLAAGMRDNSGMVASAARSAVRNAVNAAKDAGEIHSPSRRTAREIGKPLVQGIAIGIDRNSRLVNQSMSRAIDLSGVTGTSPTIGGTGGQPAAGVNLHIHNPVVRDLQSEAWEAAQLVGQVV
jgi:hypothetical protein